MGGEGALRLDGRGERVAGAGEGGEEGISLRIHFLAAVGIERGAHQPAMLGQDVGVMRTHLLQQARGAFDVGEQGVMVPAGSSGTRALLSRHSRCYLISSIVADSTGHRVRYSSRPTSSRAMMMR